MKIIGGRDYYDGAGMGVDETIILVRKKRLFSSDEHPFELAAASGSSTGQPCLVPFVVLFAGEAHPGVIEHHPSRNEWKHGLYTWIKEKRLYHYTLDEALSCVKSARDEGRRHRFGIRSAEEVLTEHFSRSITPAQVAWMVDNSVKTGVLHYEAYPRVNDGPLLSVDDDNLKDYEFYKKVDPATAHMRLSDWIGGVLPTSKPLVEIADKDRIRKAGFDQASFRQPKGVRKPRRRKREG